MLRRKMVKITIALMLSGYQPILCQEQSKEEIEQVVQNYFEGTQTGDVQLLDKAFHEKSLLKLLNDEGSYTEWTYSGEKGYREFIADRGGSEHSVKILSVDFTGNAAMVKAKLDFTKFHYIDYLSLLKIEGRWKIVNKIAHKEINKGKVTTLKNFRSDYVPNRNIEIYTPPGYTKDKTYSVLYMQDGQNIFNPETSYAGVEWAADEVLDSLIGHNIIEPMIVVAPWNSKYRMNEYMPEDGLPPYKTLMKRFPKLYSEYFNDTIIFSNKYLKFLTKELKPYIDQNYATKPGKNNTYIMGSSGGGLISAYAVSKYPNIFGKAACLSTHWPAFDGAAIQYFAEAIPPAGNHSFYFDHGTEGLDAAYGPFQKRIDQLMRSKGYHEGGDWVTYVFEGTGHFETFWSNRLHIPFKFLSQQPEID
ncbi:nuclear transport factor 2 family protein [Flagellimonas algicola]|uniref:Esterase n=1 Tax=Flagellimonas algicola TaxID=2583815 RepID=A0ABY2WGJ8_9FLAO|nr:nuclear transport factor 2 family protein [Allomuricauda algicola]TMU50399.1 hypothetical protein FGG15_19825 [Allomuricauda algicola]